MDGADPTFEEYVRARWASLVRYGYVLTGSPHDTSDLAQEALARLTVTSTDNELVVLNLRAIS